MSYYYQVGGTGNGPSVFIATPAYNGLSAAYVASLADTIPYLISKGICPVLAIQSGYCHVDDARNILIGEFLASDCQNMVFIDADTGWKAKDLYRLITLERDFVAGAPPLKRDEEQYAVKLDEPEIWADKDGLVKVVGVGGAFIRLSRYLLQTLFDKEPRKWKETENSKVSALLFERTFQNEQRFSGDYGFCNRVLREGFDIYVDPEMEFTHFGEKPYAGSWGNWLRKINNVPLSVDDYQKLYREWGNNYAATPDLLEECASSAKQAKRILEAGTGLTTLVMARSNPDAEIVSLEHDPEWAAKIRKEMALLGITNVKIIESPLKDYGDKVWYSDMPEGEFDLVVCDGPPRDLSDRSKIYDIKTKRLIIDDVEGEKRWQAI